MTNDANWSVPKGTLYFYNLGFTVINFPHDQKTYGVVDGKWYPLKFGTSYEEFSKKCIKN